MSVQGVPRRITGASPKEKKERGETEYNHRGRALAVSAVDKDNKTLMPALRAGG